MAAGESFEKQNVVVFARQRFGFYADEVQARVMRETGGRVLLNCSRQWGKSTITAIKAVHRAYFWPESLVLVVSPSARQSAEFLKKARPLVMKLGLRVRGDGDNPISLAFPNGSRIVGLPGREDTVRGFSSVSLMLIDEASRVKDAMYDAVTPMLARSDGDLWLMSTPRGKRGFFWTEWSTGGPEWSRIAVKATDCDRYSPKFLDEERRRKGEAMFAQEYLCEFVQADDCLFREEDLDPCFDNAIPPFFLESGLKKK